MQTDSSRFELERQIPFPRKITVGATHALMPIVIENGYSTKVQILNGVGSISHI